MLTALRLGILLAPWIRTRPCQEKWQVHLPSWSIKEKGPLSTLVNPRKSIRSFSRVAASPVMEVVPTWKMEISWMVIANAIREIRSKPSSRKTCWNDQQSQSAVGGAELSHILTIRIFSWSHCSPRPVSLSRKIQGISHRLSRWASTTRSRTPRS